MTNPLHLPADIRSPDWPGMVRPTRPSIQPTSWLRRKASAVGQAFHTWIASPAGRRSLVLGSGLFLTCVGWSLRRTTHWSFLAWYSRWLHGDPLENSNQIAKLLIEIQELGLLALIFGIPLVLLAVHDWLRGGHVPTNIDRS